MMKMEIIQKKLIKSMEDKWEINDMNDTSIFLETERLILRKMTQLDYNDLCKILQDEEVMYAYEGAFSNEEVQNWLDRQMQRYQDDGFGLCAVILKENGKMIGQCGLTMQEIPNGRVVEVGYLFQKKYWHKGYATEAAKACKQYAFNVLNVKEVFSIVRDNNIASQKVAKRNGMTCIGTFTKHYRGIDMPHYLFSVKCQSRSNYMNREKIIKYINEKYHNLQEYPWEDKPTYMTFKHENNKKWFALIIDIPFEKLKINKQGIVDIINLKNIPEMIGGLRKQQGILPAYHMNKEHWITVLLDGSVNEEKIYELIDVSYELTMKK